MASHSLLPFKSPMSASLWQSLIWSHASWDFGRCSSEASQGTMENGVGWDDMELTTNWQKEHLSLIKAYVHSTFGEEEYSIQILALLLPVLSTFIYVSLGGA